jgi:hypothetical protein
LLEQLAGQVQAPWARDFSAQSPWLGRIDRALPGLPTGSANGTIQTVLWSNRSGTVPLPVMPEADATPGNAAALAQNFTLEPRLDLRPRLEVQDQHGIVGLFPLLGDEASTEESRPPRDGLFIAMPLSAEGSSFREAGMANSEAYVDSTGEEEKRGPLGWRWGQAVLRLTVACCLLHIFHRFTTSRPRSRLSDEVASRRQPSPD